MIVVACIVALAAALGALCFLPSWLIWRDERAWYREHQRILREWKAHQAVGDAENGVGNTR